LKNGFTVDRSQDVVTIAVQVWTAGI
jgi:hypothetical protein